ncbi:site-specific integrase [Pseudomonas sp. CCI3.2]|uniref:tyrosine-type recombinase/integrase n=1 Tax=unclassified Pseudomonas TaxID=196821 RepID=UPI002B227B97|nr:MULTISPECIES: site-specific integrase [unclassified Pseudomonas]MEB0078071.1 site-specific integrase [Pseudomonas sp. MH10out]MEB0103187.1 site-specific integrase [Pseudomonas sp. CCI3.2]MEB0132876.1 site-specific integrase [Pseudomonas sp. CCI2.4]
MASYEKRGESWRAQIRRKGHPSLSATFDTKAEAQRWAAEIEGDMSRSRFVDTREAESTTLFKALERYENEVTKHKKGSKQEAVRIHKWQVSAYALKSLAGIRSSDMAEYRDAQIKLGRSPATVRLDLAVISHLYSTASKDWGIEGIKNPCQSIRMPKGSKERNRRPSAAELKKIYKFAKELSAELPVIIELAVETAMRRSELVMLRKDQIRGKVVFLEDTKNGERRSVPLSSRALELLRGLPTPIDEGRYFHLLPDTISNYFPLVCEKAEIVDLRFHDMRHEATSRLFERGLSLMEVASITGHKTLAMLKRYTHLSPHDLAEKLG